MTALSHHCCPQYSVSDRRQERWITHYSSSQRILLIGEGDFSFSSALASAFGSAENITATSLDSLDEVLAKYGWARETLSNLSHRGAIVMHHVNATTMARHVFLGACRFDIIVWNLPHAGFFARGESHESVIEKHKTLLVSFFSNASKLLEADGEVHVSHHSRGPYKKWNIENLAQFSGMRLNECVPFLPSSYAGYLNRRGVGKFASDSFALHMSKTYKFVKRRRALNPLHSVVSLPEWHTMQLVSVDNATYRASRFAQHHAVEVLAFEGYQPVRQDTCISMFVTNPFSHEDTGRYGQLRHTIQSFPSIPDLNYCQDDDPVTRALDLFVPRVDKGSLAGIRSATVVHDLEKVEICNRRQKLDEYDVNPLQDLSNLIERVSNQSHYLGVRYNNLGPAEMPVSGLELGDRRREIGRFANGVSSISYRSTEAAPHHPGEGRAIKLNSTRYALDGMAGPQHRFVGETCTYRNGEPSALGSLDNHWQRPEDYVSSSASVNDRSNWPWSFSYTSHQDLRGSLSHAVSQFIDSERHQASIRASKGRASGRHFVDFVKQRIPFKRKRKKLRHSGRLKALQAEDGRGAQLIPVKINRRGPPVHQIGKRHKMGVERSQIVRVSPASD